MKSVDVAGFDDLVRHDVGLAPLTTYRFGGNARFFAEVGDLPALTAVLEAWNQTEGIPLLVLGKGSNVVVSDSGFGGLVLRLAGSFLEIDVHGDGTVEAGGAATLPRLARESVRAGRGGLEWCAGIPGTVGGAVRMNAGGHGSDTAEWLVDVSVLDSLSMEMHRRDTAGLDLSYRHSSLGDGDIVVSARYRTVPRDREAGEQMIRDITRWRRDHQPGGTLNAGSVFRNPPGDAAGRIIDALGLKGFRIGGASVSARHANFFVADEGATAQDVYDLVHAVRSRVLAEVGIELHPEIRFVGSFSSSTSQSMEGRT